MDSEFLCLEQDLQDNLVKAPVSVPEIKVPPKSVMASLLTETKSRQVIPWSNGAEC